MARMNRAGAAPEVTMTWPGSMPSPSDAFLKVESEKRPELVNFAVKVGISEGKQTEYFWITDFTRTGDQFSGKIGNTPQIVKNLTLGNR